MNSPYLLYGFAGLMGFFFPFRLSQWAVAFIVSVLFDDLRYGSLSLTNLFLVAFLARVSLSAVSSQNIKATVLLLPALAWIGIAGAANFLGDATPEHRKALISFCSLVAAACAIAQVGTDRGRLQIMIRAMLWLSGLTAASVIGEWVLYNAFGILLKDNVFGYLNLNRDLLQGTGLFESNGIAALHMLPGLALACFLVLGNPPQNERRTLKLYIPLVCLGLVLTLARAALISILVLAAVALVCQAVITRSRLLKFMVVSGLAGLVILTPLFLNFIADFNKGSYIARRAIINGALDEIEEHPVIGSGPGSTVAASFARGGAWMDEAVALGLQYDQSLRDTHNTVLQIAVDMGLLGLLCFGFVNARILRRAWRLLKYHGNPEARRWTLALVYALLITEFFSVFDSVLYLKPLWLMLGLAAGAVSAVPVRRPALFPTSPLIPKPAGVVPISGTSAP